MRRLLLICLLLICNVAIAGPPEEKFLCRKDEQVVFGCNLGKKVLSLCASAGSSSTDTTFQYRFGTSSRLELQVPDTLSLAKDHFWFSSTAYSGGGAAHIRFVNADYEYVLFDSTVRTNFGKSGRHDPQFDAGVLILHQGKTVSLRHCSNDAAIQAIAYKQIPQEEYKYYDEIP